MIDPAIAQWLLPVSLAINGFFLMRVFGKLDALEKCLTEPENGVFVRLTSLEQSRDDGDYNGPKRRRSDHPEVST